MNHAELTAAVRASELLAPSSADRHGVYLSRTLPAGRPDPLAAWRRADPAPGRERAVEHQARETA